MPRAPPKPVKQQPATIQPVGTPRPVTNQPPPPGAVDKGTDGVVIGQPVRSGGGPTDGLGGGPRAPMPNGGAGGLPNFGQPGGGPAFSPGNTPGLGQFGGFDPGGLSNVPLRNMIGKIASQFQDGSIQNFNRAAGRMRERLDSSGAADADRITNASVGRGFGASGSQNTQLQQSAANTQNAYGQGLVGLETSFEDSRQKGLQGALNATGQLIGNDEHAQRIGADMTRGRENDASNERRGSENDASNERNAKLGVNSEFLKSMFGNLFNNSGGSGGGGGGGSYSGGGSSSSGGYRQYPNG